MHPVHGYTEADRLKSIKDDADRRWASFQSNPASHWFYVSHTASGQVVGATEWQVNTTNPFPKGPVQLKCTWFPEGETRDFVTNIINQCYYPRMNWMDRPHICRSPPPFSPRNWPEGRALTSSDPSAQ
nr:hypothetical protein CFP56_16611 [Quercus suber]